MEIREIGMHEKVATKRNRFGIWGLPLGATTLCHIFLKNLFMHNICLADSLPVL